MGLIEEPSPPWGIKRLQGPDDHMSIRILHSGPRPNIGVFQKLCVLGDSCLHGRWGP